MQDVLLSLVPVVTLIVLGAILRRVGLLKAEGWQSIERLTYYVLFPPLLFSSIIAGAFADGEAMRLSLVLAGTVAAMAVLMLALRFILRIEGPQFASVFQAGIRWNGYVALGIISGLYGQPGVGLVAVGLAVLAPVNNALSLSVLRAYGTAERIPATRLVVRMLLDPVIIAALLACALVAMGVRPSGPISQTLDFLGDATIALGLICVGAAIDPAIKPAKGEPMILGVLLRLVVMPAITLALGSMLGLGSMGFTVAVVCAAAPVATTAYVLSRQFGGDAGLMARLITVTTAASMITVPLSIFIVRALT